MQVINSDSHSNTCFDITNNKTIGKILQRKKKGHENCAQIARVAKQTAQTLVEPQNSHGNQ
jgi:hypothetical protein